MIALPAIEITRADTEHRLNFRHGIGKCLQWRRQQDHVAYTGEITPIHDHDIGELEALIIDAPDMAARPIGTQLLPKPKGKRESFVSVSVTLKFMNRVARGANSYSSAALTNYRCRNIFCERAQETKAAKV